MENTITLNTKNLSEDEREQLIKLVEKANKKENGKVWKPKDNEEYFYFCGDGVTTYDYWENSKADNRYYSIGNCFKTKEDAEFALEKLRVIAELKRFAEGNNECVIDWNNHKTNKYFIFYNHLSDNISVCERSFMNFGCIYFTSEKIAFEAIRRIGVDRLKKYYFEVED